jgi:CubicO group peptidase (beta-lactamase class C family)
VDVVAVDAYMQARADDDTFSGVVRIERSAEVLLERGYGLASRAWGVPCSPEQRFDTASVTKLFTAVAVLQQVEAGAFSLDVSATGYLGLEGTAIDPAVTPYHLLTHTSGMVTTQTRKTASPTRQCSPNGRTTRSRRRSTSCHSAHTTSRSSGRARERGTATARTCYSG